MTSSSNTIMQRACRQEESLATEPFDFDRDDVVLIFENDELKKGECVLRSELFEIYHGSDVTIWKDKRRRLMKLPFSGVWIEGGIEFFIDDEYTTCYVLGESTIEKIGSEHGVSTLHDTKEQVYPLVKLDPDEFEGLEQLANFPNIKKNLSTVDFANGTYRGKINNETRVPNDFGTLYINNKKIRGNWNNGKIQGFGTFENSEPYFIAIGRFENDKFLGTQYGPEKRVMQGTFINFLLEGKGVMQDWNGKTVVKYTGDFKAGVAHGSGRYVEKGVKIFDGTWEHGKFIDGTVTEFETEK